MHENHFARIESGAAKCGKAVSKTECTGQITGRTMSPSKSECQESHCFRVLEFLIYTNVVSHLIHIQKLGTDWTSYSGLEIIQPRIVSTLPKMPFREREREGGGLMGGC